LPIEHWPTAEHLYSATGLAPASYQSAPVRRRDRISRQGLAEHRDALMSIACGLSQYSPAFIERDREYRARGFRSGSKPESRSPATPAASPGVSSTRCSAEFDYRGLDTAFQLQIARVSRNSLLEDGVERARLLLNDAILAQPESAAWHERVHREHESILAALRAHDPERAARAMDICSTPSRASTR